MSIAKADPRSFKDRLVKEGALLKAIMGDSGACTRDEAM